MAGAIGSPGPASCPPGETLILPTSGWTDGLGVSHVTYKADPGLVAMIPPHGLTVGKVTTTLLADVGLRTHSARSASYERMVRQVLDLAKNQRAPEFCRSSPGQAMLETIGAAGSSTRNGVQVNSIWAGYATTEKERGTSITNALGAWTVPRHTAGLAPSAESTWVGIGGGPDGETARGLIQTGTSMQTNEGYRSWWEYIGTSGCTGFCGRYSSINAISHGDSVIGEVDWTSSSTACFFFADLSRSTGSWDLCRTVNIPYDPTSAEWINENHLYQGYYYDNPHTVYWSGMLAGKYGHPLTSPFSHGRRR